MQEVNESGSGNRGAAQPSNINESLGSRNQEVSSKNESSVRVDNNQSASEQLRKRLNEIEEKIESNRILEKIHRESVLGPAFVAAQNAHDHRIKFENFMRASGIPIAVHDPTNPSSSLAGDQRRRRQVEQDLHREQQRCREQHSRRQQYELMQLGQEDDSREQQLGDQIILQEVKKQKMQVKRELLFDELGGQKMLQEVKEQKIQVKRQLLFDELGGPKMLQEVKEQKIQVTRELLFDGLEGHEDVEEEKQQQPFTEQPDGINAYLQAPPDQIIITKFGYSICVRDIRTLGPECWLNDEIINFYLNLVMERSKQFAEELPSVFVFNTFFLNRLRLSCFEGVRRWTRKVDIFGKDLVIVPYLHENKAWVMILINMRRKEIIYFDSLNNSDPIPLMKLLQSYLLDESWDKRQQHLDKRAFTYSKATNLPLQSNEYDSGVFVCQFAEVLTRSKPIKFTQAYMDVFRQTMIYEIVKGELSL